MSENIEKVLQLAKQIVELREEIAAKQYSLAEWENEVIEIMRELDSNELKSEIKEVMIKKEVKEIEKFDSPAFKKADPDMYEKYRIPKKRFDQKTLKEEKPEVYEEYIVKESKETITIERYITKDSLPSL